MAVLLSKHLAETEEKSDPRPILSVCHTCILSLAAAYHRHAHIDSRAAATPRVAPMTPQGERNPVPFHSWGAILMGRHVMFEVETDLSLIIGMEKLLGVGDRALGKLVINGMIQMSLADQLPTEFGRHFQDPELDTYPLLVPRIDVRRLSRNIAVYLVPLAHSVCTYEYKRLQLLDKNRPSTELPSSDLLEDVGEMRLGFP